MGELLGYQTARQGVRLVVAGQVAPIPSGSYRQLVTVLVRYKMPGSRPVDVPVGQTRAEDLRDNAERDWAKIDMLDLRRSLMATCAS